MKKYIYLPILVLTLLIASCSSDDNGSSEAMDFGESAMTLSGDYDFDLEGRAIFSISEEQIQGLHQFTISLSGDQEKRYNMDLILRLEDMNYQALEGSTLPISNVFLSNNAEAYVTDLVLYGESYTDVVAEWTSLEDDGNGVGTVSITKANDDVVEGTFQASLMPKAGEASQPIIISPGTFRAVLSR